MAKPKKAFVHTHRFEFHMELPDGKMHSFHYKAKVKTPSRSVKVPLKAKYAEEAIRNDGCGNSQRCAMSTAIAHNADLFPHAVLGIVDFHKRTCFVASKATKDGRITECYRYLHSDNIADRNDKPYELKKLAAELRAQGDQVVTLSPRLRERERTKRDGTGKRTGERSSLSSGEYVPRAGKRRYALASGGRQPGLPAL